MKHLSPEVCHLFPLTSNLRKARFKEGFMDTEENTVVQDSRAKQRIGAGGS